MSAHSPGDAPAPEAPPCPGAPGGRDSPFPPTLFAARARIAAVRPADYARTRNALNGAVTRLSPYITHGFVSLPEVLRGVSRRYRLNLRHPLVMELGWREYFHHVWQYRGDGILQSLHAGPLPEHRYRTMLPDDIRHACTGVPAIDQAVRTLYATGYLHNHARLWLASYVVHLRHVHWRAGADWMLTHLLDGDLACNHLSWQWVAGTASTKAYLFNADNVARYAPPDWHSAGSVVDTAYEQLDTIARGDRPVPAPAHPLGGGTDEPTTSIWPPAAGPADAAAVADRHVWLVHPWALGEPPGDLPPGFVIVGWWPTEHHQAWPWSAARWAFAGTRMAALARFQWHCSGAQAAQALAAARSVRMAAHRAVDHLLPEAVCPVPATRLFRPVDGPCGSFSQWWKKATHGLDTPGDLPGLAQPPTGEVRS